MKNIVFTFMSLAVAAVAVLSCTEMPDNGTIEQDSKAEGVTIRVISGKTPTKTMAVDGEIPTIQWADSDKISLFEIVDDDVKGSAQSGDACIDSEGRACFNTTLGWEDPGGSAYQYSAVYPADNVIEEGGKYYIFIPAKQTLKENNFSEDSDVLFSTPLDHGTTRVSDGEDVMFSFRRLGTVVRLTLAGIEEGAIISEVTIKAPTHIAGAIEYDPVTGTVNPESAFVYDYSNTVSLTLDDLEATGSDVLWFRVMCGEAWAAGAEFTIKVMTDKAVYEKEVTLPSAIKFPDGGLTKFRVNLEGCHPEPVQVPCVWDFEDDAEGWSFYDKDGDGYGWEKASDTGLSMSGFSFLCSASYENNIVGALSPDNWAFTPPIQLTEGNYLSFWTRPKDSSFPDAYAVYITDESPTGTMTTLLPLTCFPDGECAEWGPDGIYQHIVVQIPGEFDNKIVYIAFQHNDCNQLALILDDVAVTEENPIQDATATYEDYLGKWAKGTRVYTIESKVDGESYSISGLNGQGDYEVEAKFEDHRLVLYEQIVAQDGDKTVALQGSGNKDPGYPDGTPVVIFSALYDKGNNQLSINHESAYNFIDFFTYEGQTVTDDVYEEIPVSLIPYVPDIATYLYYEDFESDNSSSWTFIDADGDGKLWSRESTLQTYSGGYALTSASYDTRTYNILYPDNWAFTPPVTLTSNNYLSFWVRAQDSNYPKEHYAVYITDNAPTAANLGDCTVLLAEQEYPNGNYVALAGDGYYQRYVIQIPSSFDGKTVYIGFRHFNCSDQFQLNIDDVAVAQGNPVTD